MDNQTGNICMCRKCDGIVHTIRRGDTLYLLSRQYNVSVNDIMNANRNINIYNLRIGDKLCIPTRRVNSNSIIGEIIEEIVDRRDVEITESVETMEVVQETIADIEDFSDKKVSDVLNENLTIKELARMLKEIDI